MSSSGTGGIQPSFASQIGTFHLFNLWWRSSGEFILDHSHKGFVIGDAGGSKNGSVESVGAFAEGDDGGARGVRSVVGAS